MNEERMKKACEKKVKECVSKIESHFKVKMVTPKVSLHLRGCAAGKASSRDNTVYINKVLLSENFDEMIAQTVPHEVAHLATKVIHRYRVQPHGYEWKEVMWALGLDATRCHRFDVSNAQVKHRERFEINCPCSVHRVTKTVLNRMRRGVTYHCRKCGGLLQHW